MSHGPMPKRLYNHNLQLAISLAAMIVHGFGCQKTSVKPMGSTVAATTAADAAMSGLVYRPAATPAQIRQEALLHANLYRAAYETNVGDFTRHFLLEPVQEAGPPQLGLDPGEFKELVLRELHDLNVPIAWVLDTWRTPGVEYFPGTAERATRLRIKILSRNENQATVDAEVGDVTADVGSSRQAVTATWDGRNWVIERDRVRLVW